MTSTPDSFKRVRAIRLAGARLLDGLGREPLVGAIIDIGVDGRVAAVHADPTKAPPHSGAATYDLGGRTVMPGMIDAHVHFRFGGGLSPFGASDDPVVHHFNVVARMQATLDAGVTSARDLGGVTPGYEDARRAGAFAGPRLQVAGRVIGHTGGHCDGTDHTGTNTTAAFVSIADNESQLRVAARTQLREGAGVIKVCATGGMGSPHDDPDDLDLTEAEMRAVVDEGRRHRHRPVAVHAQGEAGVLAAAHAGVASIEHGYGITDEAIDLMLANGTFLVPTLSTVFQPLDPEKMAPHHFDKKSRWQGVSKERIAHAISRGVRVATGTDAGISPHAKNLTEIGWLVELGMSPIDAIVAATGNGADLLGWGDVGVLRPGAHADLLVLDVDPLVDVFALASGASVRAVMQGGRTVRGTLA